MAQDNLKEGSSDIGDQLHHAVLNSIKLINSIQLQIQEAQQIDTKLWYYFSSKSRLSNLSKKHIELYTEFQKQYLNPMHSEKTVFISDGTNFSYLNSSLVGAFRKNLTDEQRKNPMIILSLYAQQESYENLVQRFEALLNQLSQEINNKNQELNNVVGMALNFMMLFLTIVAVSLASYTVIKGETATRTPEHVSTKLKKLRFNRFEYQNLEKGINPYIIN